MIMRPVNKGASPRSYSKYQDAQSDLVECVGDYCSYCERQIETNLAVEHVQPKSEVPEMRNEWSNFLLGCVNCNSCKSDTVVDIDGFLWPDADNTFLAFTYSADGIVSVNTALPLEVASRAQSTLLLVGLDRVPGHPDKTKWPTSKDKRWQRRLEAWGLATRDLARLQRGDTVDVRELIVENAQARGLFSIWMKVFDDDADMRQRLIAGFKGTATDCFDASGNPVPRHGGKL